MVFEQDLCSGMVSITPPFKGNHYPGHRSVGGAAPKGYRGVQSTREPQEVLDLSSSAALRLP